MPLAKTFFTTTLKILYNAYAKFKQSFRVLVIYSVYFVYTREIKSFLPSYAECAKFSLSSGGYIKLSLIMP